MKILITGGHLTPALAVIDRIIASSQNKDISFVFVGRKYSLESEQTYSFEYKEITKRNIPFISLHAGRLTRFLSYKSIRSILRIPLGFFHALFVLRQESPDIILSFGGYLALPIAFAGWLYRKPIFTHEQTMHPGLSNRIIAYFSKKIFYSFPETKKFFPSGRRTILSGNPIRKTVFEVRKKPFEIQKTKPVIYITGGSLGSHGINNHIRMILPNLLRDFIVIHQTGNVKEFHDYDRLVRYRRTLQEDLRNRYYPVEHFFDEEIGYIYSIADIVVSRSGANTFFELIQLRKPAVLIPLPWSANKEQQLHGNFFAKNGLGEVFEQHEQSTKLLEFIQKIASRIDTYKKHFLKLPFQIRQDATDTIIKEILNI